MDMRDIAERAVELGARFGAGEVRARVGRSVHVSLTRRDGQLEKTSQATTQGLSVSLLVDDRYSAHGTSDLRPDAIAAFIQQAVEATRFLEPDPDRRMADREQMGHADLDALDMEDAGFGPRDPQALRADVAGLEEAVRAGDPGDMVSAAAHLWEVRSEGCTVFSNGFSLQRASTSFGRGAEMTFREGGKLPEAYSFFSAPHLADVPGHGAVNEELWARADLARNTSACASGRYPMLLENRAAGRVLSAILRPLSGSAIWEKRSCYLDRLGEKLGAGAFTLYDDPLIPRAPGSRICDGDAFPSIRREVFTEGVLKTFFLDLYHARKLDVAPTTGGASNLVIPAGTRDWRAIAAERGEVIRVTSFLGGNANPTTGDFSFGIRGQLLRDGEPVQNLSEMNISGNIMDLLANYQEAADDTWTWSSWRVPSLLFDGVQFSGT